MAENVYLCIGNGRKGPNSRMSDECLMKQETVFSFYTQYQAVTRKFTLANQTFGLRWQRYILYFTPPKKQLSAYASNCPIATPLARYLWFKVLRTLIILSGAQASKLGKRFMVNDSNSQKHKPIRMRVSSDGLKPLIFILLFQDIFQTVSHKYYQATV